ncbi:MAG: formimidoylglutamate deiminase [Myxococcota bacterium]|nr:formimidoylglutamate deiminase [Myxococcota bacterium]
MRYRVRMLVQDDAVLENVVLEVTDGHISAIDDGPHTHDLGDVVALPGHVNAHSHAFQRGIRGRTEYVDVGRSADDFWSWRARMYGLAERLTPEQLYTISKMAFLEMALSGITSVGEFHYLHHQRDGTPYDDPNELAHQVIKAATDVGLRITLLRVAYERAGARRPLESHQRRFSDGDVDLYLSRVETLSRAWRDVDTVDVGYAPHSVRAVSAPWLESIGLDAERHGRPLHIHACEQRRELEECVAEYGHGPVQVLAQTGILTPKTTLVHATHLDAAALSLIDAMRPTICACPTTERNLGDGFLPTSELIQRDIPIALGSDGQSEINLFQDVRLLEYHERLRVERRNVLAEYAPVSLGQRQTADVLWPMLNRHGARALGTPVGQLIVGAPADFTTVDLSAPSLAGTDAIHIRSDSVFSVNPRSIYGVFVAGKPIVEGGHHRHQQEIISAFRTLMTALN